MSGPKKSWKVVDRYVDPDGPAGNLLRHALLADGGETGYGIVRVGIDEWEVYAPGWTDYALAEDWRGARREAEAFYEKERAEEQPAEGIKAAP